jgi:para-nitrobenzyl esterase
MADAWTRFARTGDPNGPGLPHWPTYDAEHHATMAFDLHSNVMLDPLAAERKAWDGVESKRFESGDVLQLGD